MDFGSFEEGNTTSLDFNFATGIKVIVMKGIILIILTKIPQNPLFIRYSPLIPDLLHLQSSLDFETKKDIFFCIIFEYRFVT